MDGGCQGEIPVGLKRCSSLEYAPQGQYVQYAPALQGYTLGRPSTVALVSTTGDQALTPTDPQLVFSNGFTPTRPGDAVIWPTLQRQRGVNTWGDYGLDTFVGPRNGAGDMELSVHGDTLPTMNSAEAYACRHTPGAATTTYGYFSELHNHFGPIDPSPPPLMNNMLTLRSQARSPITPTPVILTGGELTKNDLQPAPPMEFADNIVKVD